MLPKIKVNWRIEFQDDGDARLKINDTDAFWRVHHRGECSGRWRYAAGPFVGVYRIAQSLFDYGDEVSDDEIEYMEEFVRGIGEAIDSAAEWVSAKRRSIKTQVQVVYRTEERRRKSEGSFVYLMRHANGLTKIGWSSNPHLREKTLQAEDPRLEMIWCRPCEKHIEKRLHDIFASVRVRGEWFKLAFHHIEWIEHVVT